jgi:hypothetical protein
VAHVNVVALFSHPVMNNIYMVSKRTSTTIYHNFKVHHYTTKGLANL